MSGINRKDFARWLAEQRSDATIVGIPRQSCDCPIARWLIARGEVDVEVSPGEVLIGSPVPTTYFLPPWALRFVAEVDAQPVQRITRKRALRVLEGEA